MARTTTTRQLRAHLSREMDRAAKGEEIVVTRRGVPYVRLLPAATPTKPSERYPLRGSVLWIADDFDAPMTELWDALTK